MERPINQKIIKQIIKDTEKVNRPYDMWAKYVLWTCECEDYKDKEKNNAFIEEMYDEYISNKWTPECYRKCVDFVNNIKFPLTIYRGLKTNNGKDRIDMKNLGKSWTVDKNLFLTEHFHDVDRIFEYTLEDDSNVSWEGTIFNYMCIVPNCLDGRMGFENEIAIKENIENPKLYNREDFYK